VGDVAISSTLDVVGDVAISSNLAVDTNTLFVDSVGNKVGIGTDNPYTTLVVKKATTGVASGHGALNILQQLGSDDITAQQHQTQIRIVNGLGVYGSRAIGIGVLDNGVGAIQVSESGVGYNSLILNPVAGNVGIGTNNPQYKLHVQGSLYCDSAEIADYIYHSGDTNTYFGFNDDDSFVVRTNGVDRINVNSAGNVTLGVNLYIPDYIYHSGNTDTYFGFSAADSFVVRTGGTDRLTITDSAVAVAGTLTAGTKVGTPLIENGGTLTVGSTYNYLTDVRGGGTIKFTIDNVQRGKFTNSGLTLESGGSALNYFKNNSNGGAWTGIGQNGTGFNINGQVAYTRVGNLCSAMTRRCEFYGQGNFYLRHPVPSEFRPDQGSDILYWPARVTTNSTYQCMAYYQNSYFYVVNNISGGNFAAGNGTQHNFSSHSVSYSVA